MPKPLIGNASRVLADGTYDAIVLDATAADDGAMAVELTILAGAHKGEVVAVRAAATGRDPLDLLGIPATLTVEGGQPALTFED